MRYETMHSFAPAASSEKAFLCHFGNTRWVGTLLITSLSGSGTADVYVSATPNSSDGVLVKNFADLSLPVNFEMEFPYPYIIVGVSGIAGLNCNVILTEEV